MNSPNCPCEGLATMSAWHATHLFLPIWDKHMGTLGYNARVVKKNINIDSGFINIKNYTSPSA